jgi:hypothetical protein
MALLRSVGVPTRFHGFMIDMRLQIGLANGIVFKLAPEKLLHCWAEVYFDGKWFNLEGVVILDNQYLRKIMNRNTARIRNSTNPESLELKEVCELNTIRSISVVN